MPTFHEKYGYIRDDSDTKTHCSCCGHYYPTLKEAEHIYHHTRTYEIEFYEIYQDLQRLLKNELEFHYDSENICFKDQNYGLHNIHAEKGLRIEDTNKIVISRQYDLLLGFIANKDCYFTITIGHTIFEYSLKKGQFQPCIEKKYPLNIVGLPYFEIIFSCIPDIQLIFCNLWNGRGRLSSTCSIYKKDDNSFYISKGGCWIGLTETIPNEEYLTYIPYIVSSHHDICES